MNSTLGKMPHCNIHLFNARQAEQSATTMRVRLKKSASNRLSWTACTPSSNTSRSICTVEISSESLSPLHFVADRPPLLAENRRFIKLSNRFKTCTGDSASRHCWGQSASGELEAPRFTRDESCLTRGELGFEGRCCRESFRCGIVEERPGTHDIGGARARAGGSWIIDPGAGSARVLSLLPRLPRDRQLLDASIRINSSDRSWLPLSPFGRKLAGEFLKSDVFVHA
mmetsp:Transcript_22777/g.51545  ORF Transcript_22777/g.51545 Transcript_22777/m.51545 type:complete len:227 (+) Transcript_22777:3554-4234(+)